MIDITLTVDMNEELAEALAQFVKRVSFSEIQSNAVDDIGPSSFRVEVALENKM